MVMPASLVLFAFYWLIVVLSYRAQRRFALIAAIATTIFGYLAGAIQDVPAFIQIILLAVTAFACRASHLRFRTFVGCATLIFAASVAFWIPRSLEIADLLRRYPQESLRDRLTPRSQHGSAKSDASGFSSLMSSLLQGRGPQLEIPPAAASHMEAVEVVIRKKRRAKGHRARMLAKLSHLHESAMKIFQDSPGFGTSRIRDIPIRKQMIDLPELVPIPFPNVLPSDQLTADVNAVEPWIDTLPTGERIWKFKKGHALGVADFVNPLGFGYGRRRFGRSGIDNVIAFQPHGFRSVPSFSGDSDSTSWLVERLDLVSLLLSEPPAVYVSEKLPRMDELSNAPTRALTQFEAKGLKRLREGETLALSSRTNVIRMLGAVRASRSCLKCHDAHEGTLLGAFSYVLRRRALASRD